MAGVAGILIPDILTHVGLLNVPVWYNQGLIAQQGSFAPFSAPRLRWPLARLAGPVRPVGVVALAAPAKARLQALCQSEERWGTAARTLIGHESGYLRKAVLRLACWVG